MKGSVRREEIIKILSGNKGPVSGASLAKRLEVSRQIIVQDIALIRTGGTNILSTTQGYILGQDIAESMVYKVHHTEAETEDELNLIVDYGGSIEDVFVYHRVYGTIRVPLNIRTRMDVKKYVQSIKDGKSSNLMNITSGYHYHTVKAENKQVLSDIYEALSERGFLAQLQDYEPKELLRVGKKEDDICS